MKDKIKYYYDKGFWTEDMVKNAVIKGKITKQDFTEITGDNYDKGDKGSK